LFAVCRADIESFARELEARGRTRATVTRRLCTIAGFYKYAVEGELLNHSPAACVRCPRVDYEPHAVALDRNGLGALLVAAGLGPPCEHALISLLALNGLRVSEATGADIEQLGGHHLAGAHGAGDRPGRRRLHGRAGVPGCGQPSAGPARCRADRPQDRPPRRDRQGHHASRAQTRIHHRCAACRRPPRTPGPRTTMRYDRARGSLDRHAAYIVAAYVAGAAR
jgi:integrase